MKIFMSLLLLMLSMPVFAQKVPVVIVSDFWPAEAVQPNECVYLHRDADMPENTTEVAVSVEQTPEGRRCNIPVELFPGSHTFEIYAQNATRKSETVFFNFTVLGPPLTPPMNLRCLPESDCTVP